jgi:hypothetical protein
MLMFDRVGGAVIAETVRAFHMAVEALVEERSPIAETYRSSVMGDRADGA